MTPGRFLREMRRHIKELKRRRDRGASVTRIAYSIDGPGKEIAFPIPIDEVIRLSEEYAERLSAKIVIQRARGKEQS